VVTPFLDKKHGTERRVTEWVSRLSRDFEIHVYSQHLEDMDLSEITWHRVPKLPGPHLINFVWWFVANRIYRAWHRRVRGMRHDLVFSPGINCFDADVMSVHIVFAEYVKKQQGANGGGREPRLVSRFRTLHRKLYYRLAIWLEHRAFASPSADLVLIARKTLEELTQHYGICNRCHIIYAGLDHETFNPTHCAELRPEARAKLGLDSDRLAVMVIGNDWRNKGVAVLIKALRSLRQSPFDLLYVTREDAGPAREFAQQNGVAERVHFLPPRSDVEFYYAAADVYAGPSLEDTFALPVAEGMACGLPVIVSKENGASEIITDGIDGLILKDPQDASGLASMIGRLSCDPEFRRKMGENAAAAAKNFTWARNRDELEAVFESVLQRKGTRLSQTQVQES
jgi:UDP-glucose:(heptosyl)LPS alpha-1,3-glucosyltransferase